MSRATSIRRRGNTSVIWGCGAARVPLTAALLSTGIGDWYGIRCSCCWANDSRLSQPGNRVFAFLFFHFHPLSSVASPHFSLTLCYRHIFPSQVPGPLAEVPPRGDGGDGDHHPVTYNIPTSRERCSAFSKGLRLSTSKLQYLRKQNLIVLVSIELSKNGGFWWDFQTAFMQDQFGKWAWL